MDFRLITYNVHGFPWTQTPIKQIVAWLVKNSDLAALQEVWCRHTEWAAAFASHGWVFLRPARESHFASVFGSGLAYAWPRSRWQLQDARFYPFLRCIGIDIMVSKGWFRVDLLTPDGRPVRILNTHMQADLDLIGSYFTELTEGVRMIQARQLIETEIPLLRQQPAPTLLVGDINTGQNWFSGFQLFPGSGIDHCGHPTGQPWKQLEQRVCSEAGDWSDHLPVCWRLTYI